MADAKSGGGSRHVVIVPGDHDGGAEAEVGMLCGQSCAGGTGAVTGVGSVVGKQPVAAAVAVAPAIKGYGGTQPNATAGAGTEAVVGVVGIQPVAGVVRAGAEAIAIIGGERGYQPIVTGAVPVAVGGDVPLNGDVPTLVRRRTGHDAGRNANASDRIDRTGVYLGRSIGAEKNAGILAPRNREARDTDIG